VANKEEIDKLLKDGHCGRYVFDKLQREKKITMSLARFYALVLHDGKPPSAGKRARGKIRERAASPLPDTSQFLYDKNKDVL
jgi:hypothetical protein